MHYTNLIINLQSVSPKEEGLSVSPTDVFKIFGYNIYNIYTRGPENTSVSQIPQNNAIVVLQLPIYLK